MIDLITDAIFLFVFIFVLLYFGFPDLTTNNYIKHELILFGNVLWFYYLTQLIKKLKNKCQILPTDLFINCLKYSTYAVFGYTIYVDLLYMDWSKDYFSELVSGDNTRNYFIIGSVMTGFVTFARLVELMLISPSNSC